MGVYSARRQHRGGGGGGKVRLSLLKAMSKSSLKRLHLPKPVPHLVPPRARYICASVPCRLAGTLSPSDIWDAESSGSNLKAAIVEGKIRDLRSAASHAHYEPGRVWGTYMELQQYVRLYELPLEIHQLVLRKCTPPTSQLRVVSTKRVGSWLAKQEGHMHEARFKAIIRNIRSAGFTPSMDDYHFILEQFAAVGHYMGAMQVVDELSRLGLPRNHQTYGFCLQSMCHRLTLPCHPDFRPRVVNDITRLCMKLQVDMQEQKVPYTSLNVDLVMRLLKETADLKSFERLLKTVYGVDLSFPDRPPLELWGRNGSPEGDGARFAILGGTPESLPPILPFSTAALNTTIDFLGRNGAVSKLVQAFEVLTTPLPSKAATTSPAFDEDEDDDFGVSNPHVAPWNTPYAAPNTTTYHMLLKWLSRVGHATLARHYVLQAIKYEQDVDRQLRLDCPWKPRSELTPPSIAVNRNILLSVYGLANRDKDLELMRWVLYKTGQVIATKKSHIKYYERRRRRWKEEDEKASEAAALTINADDPQLSSDGVPSEVESGSSSSSAAAFSSYFTPSSASDEVINKTVDVPPMPYFDIDLTAVGPSSRPPPKVFNINRHLEILHQDMENLEHLESQIADVVGRTTQRVKERIGRRVWLARDVYMRDQGQRVQLSRDEWERKAQFRASKTMPPRWAQQGSARMQDRPPHQVAPGSVAANRGLMTSAFRISWS